ncbi:NfeD family protein [Flammeovirgaceae bacterium SG7u.111]|nr:NfeD family protein [Flammeovirgaceae bacterium SG7u.132]WPO35594.1 NfeD family protein [Flammeovirgaceae bacterium SG7u.111]
MKLFQVFGFILLAMLGAMKAQAQQKVFVMEIRAEIDPRMNRYVELALTEAEDIEADYVVVDMNTYGGAVNDADDIRTMFLEFETPVFVFINNNAASAGALISISCDSIYMEQGANIGAATVVMGGDGSQAPDKYQSYMRSIMRSTAESKGRDPKIAEAMVDEDLVVDSISEGGKVISFTASEAMKYGFCEGIVNSVEEVLALNGVEDYELIRYEVSATEKVISFALNPFISGVLILVIIGGIYYELQTPGVGFPIAAAVVASLLYFIPYYLNGLAENWEIVLFVVGILLIAAEIFVIPGFGVAGISGIILTVGSLVLVMVNNDFFDFTFVPSGNLASALATAMGGMFGSIVLLVVGLQRISKSKNMKDIVLYSSLEKDAGYTSKFVEDDLVGLTGLAYTVLRPSGKIKINDQVYDASTRGDFIEKGEEIIVVSDEGSSLKVKKYEKGELGF